MKRFVTDLRKYMKYTLHAAKSELKSEVIGSYLSWVWLILEPFCFMLIYTFIVQIVFHSTEEYLPVFVFIGLTGWNFFNKTVNGSVKLVKNYKNIITKVYLPKFVLLNVKMAINFFKMMVSLLIVMGMIVFYKIQISWNILYLIPLLVLLWVGTFACSSIFLHFGVFLEDLSNIVTIVLRLLFYLSGVFYSILTRLPDPFGRYLLHYNPMAYVLDEMRNVLIFCTPIDFKWYFIWLFISVVVACVGISTIYKYENGYAKVI